MKWFILMKFSKSFPEAKGKFRRQGIESVTGNQSSRLCIGSFLSREVSVSPAVEIDHLDLFSLPTPWASRDQQPNIGQQTEIVQSSHHHDGNSSLSTPVSALYSLVSKQGLNGEGLDITTKTNETNLLDLSFRETCF